MRGVLTSVHLGDHVSTAACGPEENLENYLVKYQIKLLGKKRAHLANNKVTEDSSFYDTHFDNIPTQRWAIE